jgi:hypothetical protein
MSPAWKMTIQLPLKVIQELPHALTAIAPVSVRKATARTTLVTMAFLWATCSNQAQTARISHIVDLFKAKHTMDRQGIATFVDLYEAKHTVLRRHGKYANTNMHMAGHTTHKESRANRRMGASKGRSVHLRSQLSDPFHLLVQPGSGRTCQLQYTANQGFDTFCQHAVGMIEPEKAVCKSVWFEFHIKQQE